MKNKIFNNIFLKIISVALAFILWLVLVNVSDPTTSVTISGISVQFENESAFTDKGYTYEVLDGSKISVDVSGPKSIITSLSASDISASVDLNKMSAFSDYADISVSVVKNGKIVNNVTVTPKTSSVKLSISNRSNVSFDVTSEITGKVANGYQLSSAELSPSKVRVAGPSDKVKKIASVKARYDATGASSDISADVPLIMYDSKNKEITDTDIVLSKSTARLTASVKGIKTVPIKYSTTGVPASGYKISKTQISESSVTLVGDHSILESMSEFQIPADAVDVSNITSTKTYKIWISDYLPSGIESSEGNVVTITVTIAKSK